MKQLETKDLFSAMRLLKVSGARERLKKIADGVARGKKDLTDIGIDTVLELIEGFAECDSESAFYEFLSSPFEMTADDVAHLPLKELEKNLRQLAAENDLKSFFASLSGKIISN